MSGGGMSSGEKRELAETVREACVQAALDGFERAAMAGLCHEGARELALDAIRTLDVESILRELEHDAKD